MKVKAVLRSCVVTKTYETEVHVTVAEDRKPFALLVTVVEYESPMHTDTDYSTEWMMTAEQIEELQKLLGDTNELEGRIVRAVMDALEKAHNPVDDLDDVVILEEDVGEQHISIPS